MEGPRDRFLTMALTIPDIHALLRRRGDAPYGSEPVTQLEHALQCAQLAAADDADDHLVTAALLHDLGHLLAPRGPSADLAEADDQHQRFAIPFLKPLFPQTVIEPIRLHVEAKRALCAMDPAYYERLSHQSRASLELQGGPHDDFQVKAFLARPFAEEALRLRRWDDAAKVPGAPTSSLEHFLRRAARVALA